MIQGRSVANERTRPAVHAALLAVQILFGGLPVAGKIAMTELSPFTVAGLRASGAAMVFLFIRALMARERIKGARDWGYLLLLSALGVSVNQGLFLQGLSRTTALNAQIIGTSIPALTVAAAVLLRRESAAPLKLAGIAVAAAGALYLIGAEDFRTLAATGDTMILANSACYAFYLVLARDLLARYRTLTVATWVFVFGAIPLALLGVLSATGPVQPPSPRTVKALGFLILGPSVGTYFLNAWALKRAHSSLVAIYIYCQPLVTGLLTALLLDEMPSPRSFPAAALVFAGVGMVAWAEKKGPGSSGTAIPGKAQGSAAEIAATVQ